MTSRTKVKGMMKQFQPRRNNPAVGLTHRESARIIQTPLHAHAHAHTVPPPAQVCDPPNPNFSRAARTEHLKPACCCGPCGSRPPLWFNPGGGGGCTLRDPVHSGPTRRVLSANRSDCEAAHSRFRIPAAARTAGVEPRCVMRTEKTGSSG